MLHLYFWRNDLKSAISSSSSSSPSSPAGLSSQAFQTAKKNALNSLVDGGRVGVGTGCDDAADADDDVKMDLRRSLFRRASFDDILHADELWRQSRGDLAKYALTGDEGHARLFVEAA